MGLFDKLAGGPMGRLGEARAQLEAQDVPGAMAIYEEVLASAGERADVLVKISGDLGSTGNVRQIIDLVAPRYDADRHGPATGLNLLQAYLAVGELDAAQHVLDILFALNRPELEERLYGFSNAIADQMATATTLAETSVGESQGAALVMALVTFSKPAWFFGLDALIDEILPKKVAKPRRIAFAQLSVPGAYKDPVAAMKEPDDELGRLARGIPLWLTEMFYFSEQYEPVFANGLIDGVQDGTKVYCIFSGDWVGENIQKIVAECEGGLDYIYSGTLKHVAGDYELVLRLFEVKKFRERKSFTVRWNPATADEVLHKLHDEVRTFMEWANAPTGYLYPRAEHPIPWANALAVSLSAFLAEKGLFSPAYAGQAAGAFPLGRDGPLTELESLAWLTFADRCKRIGNEAPSPRPQLAGTDLVKKAEDTLR